MKKLEMVHGGLNMVVALGVSTIVGGAIMICSPNKMGVIKKIAASIGGMAISCMAVDGVNEYVDRQWHSAVGAVKSLFEVKNDEEETTTEEDEEA